MTDRNPETGFALASRRVVRESGVEPAVVHVVKGRIAGIHAPDDAPPVPSTDLGDLVLLPGLVDSHVHVNDPGRTHWEGFVTATRAAARGGVTTLVDMPLNSAPVTTTAAALDDKLRRADDVGLVVDVGFWGGAVPGNAEALGDLARGGALGAKAFLCHSGIDDFPAADEQTLLASMRALERADRPLLLHAELEREGDVDRAALAALPPDDYRVWLESRPPSFEEEAVRAGIELARRTGARVHVVHLSAASALPMLRAAKDEGLPVTVETCPHYLALTAEEVPRGATWWKCAPPIRQATNRELLWQGLADGTIDFVVSDHSPCSPDQKHLETGDFGAAWGGIATLGLTLPVVWREAHARGFGLEQLARWLCWGPAALAGVEAGIEVGRPANLVAFDPDAAWTVELADLHFRHKLTPWTGRPVRGRVHTTWLRGEPIDERGAPRGQALLRS